MHLMQGEKRDYTNTASICDIIFHSNTSIRTVQATDKLMKNLIIKIFSRLFTWRNNFPSVVGLVFFSPKIDELIVTM